MFCFVINQTSPDLQSSFSPEGQTFSDLRSFLSSWGQTSPDLQSSFSPQAKISPNFSSVSPYGWTWSNFLS